MRLENEFTVPVAVDEAWTALLDVERLAPCMPGASVESIDGDVVTGRVKVKVGPMTMTYQGTLTFRQRDAAGHRVVLDAAANEVRGSGTATATVTATLTDTSAEGGSRTRVVVDTDLQITGRAAQFGRSVLAEISGRIIAQFADNLAAELVAPAAPIGSAGSSAPAPAPGDSGPRPTIAAARPAARPAPRSDSINLVSAAGAPILKRLLPVLAAALVLLAVARRAKKSGPPL